MFVVGECVHMLAGGEGGAAGGPGGEPPARPRTQGDGRAGEQSRHSGQHLITCLFLRMLGIIFQRRVRYRTIPFTQLGDCGFWI